MANITINGRTFTGKSISIVGSNVIIDGKESCDLNGISGKEVNISVNGDIDCLHVDCCKQVNVSGSVKDLKTQSGDVECHDVAGNVQTVSGDVDVKGDVNGSISTTSGDVECGNVAGNVKTVSGDISKN